jgi:HEAT repeat protein
VTDDAVTIPEPLREALVRAYFVDDDAARLDVRRGLGDDRTRAVVLALRAGSRQGWLTEAEWLAALSSPADATRLEATRLLAHRSTSSVVASQLRALVSDPDPLVADAAIFAVGERGDREAVDALIAVATDHVDARCRESAVAALGNIGDDRARSALIAALTDRPPVRRRAVVALANFTGPDVQAALALAHDDKDWQVRAAVEQLDRGDDES